jgi:hypothetical protein
MQLLVSFISWWYGIGWQDCARRTSKRLSRTTEYFSIGLLIPTMFAPFRQVSAGVTRGPLNMRFQAFIDRTVSRFVGFMMRFFLLIVGLLVLLVLVLSSAIWLIIWPLLPLLPLACIGLTVAGVTL